MTQLLDCLVSYFGLAEDGRPWARRYFCYHILAGPGPTPEAGVAVIVLVAINDEEERCTYCQNFHLVEMGGPAEALEAAVRYLDAYHETDHLCKVQSDFRGFRNDPATNAVKLPVTHVPVS
jgi:hypothetical protein